MTVDELLDRIAEKVARMKAVRSVVSGPDRMTVTLHDGQTVTLEVGR